MGHPLVGGCAGLRRGPRHTGSDHRAFHLYKGSCRVVGRKSPYSLYREEYATFGEEDVYDQADAKGFINLFGLPLKVKALLDIEGLGVSGYRSPNYSKFKRDWGQFRVWGTSTILAARWHWADPGSP